MNKDSKPTNNKQAKTSSTDNFHPIGKDSKWLIVDGYNVINKWPKLIKAKNKSMEFAREELNLIIQKYCDFKHVKGIVVYDGTGAKTQTIAGNPQIIFSKNNETADTIIEYMVRNHSNSQAIDVVTDDITQRNFVLGAGALCISTLNFKDEAMSALSEMREHLKE